METKQEEKQIYQLFKLSILIKGVTSLFEIISGIVVFFIPVSDIERLASYIASKFSDGIVGSFVANQITSNAEGLVTLGTIFIGAYLVFRGGIKLGLIIALLKNKLWAYPWSLFIIGLFVVFQVFELIKTLHFGIIIVTTFDLIVMYLIWREWGIVKRHNADR